MVALWSAQHAALRSNFVCRHPSVRTFERVHVIRGGRDLEHTARQRVTTLVA